MADEKSPVFNHNKTLFTKDNKPMIFFLRPCPDKTKLRPLVEHGGGKLLSKFITGAIKLAQEGDHMTASEDYISTKYIMDCVYQNKLLDFDDYRMHRRAKRKFRIDDAEELSNVSDDLSPSSSVLMEARDFKGRTKYTVEDDFAMISHIVSENRLNAVTGMQLYKDMELLKVTSHSALSMNCRFRKIVLPNITKYDIPDTWKRKFVPNYSPKKGTSNQTKMTSPYFSPKKGKEIQDKVENSLPAKLNLSKNLPKLPDKNKSSDDSSFVSEDDFDRQLKDLSKNNQKALNSTPAKGKKLCVDLSNSIVTIDKDNKAEVQDTVHKSPGDVVITEKSAKVMNSKGTTEEKNQHDSSSDDEMDVSLMRYCREEKKRSENLVKPRDGSPLKSVSSQMKDLRSPNNKRSRTHYILEDESDTEGSNDDKEYSDSEVDELQELIKRLGDTYGLLNEEILHLMMQHDGDVKETIRFIETGKTDMTWSPADDSCLQSNSGIQRLNSVYTKKRIRQRAAFLE